MKDAGSLCVVVGKCCRLLAARRGNPVRCSHAQFNAVAQPGGGLHKACVRAVAVCWFMYVLEQMWNEIPTKEESGRTPLSVQPLLINLAGTRTITVTVLM